MTRCELTVEDRKNIAKWADCNKLTFTQLYKASADGGCNAAIFHQKCDGQGPTVTVAYNNTGYVFGVYTSQSFTSSNSWVQDTKMFLFRLREAEKISYCKYPVGAYPGVYHYATHGPSFGNTYQKHEEFRFFAGNNVVGNNGVIVCNDLYTNFTGHGFQTTNLSWAALGGSNNNLVDLEVYAVEPVNLLNEDQPWRKTTLQWNDKTRERLKQEIIGYEPVSAVDVPLANILLIGQVGAGKSSFFNTVNSVFQGYITAQAVAGGSTHSLTTRYRTYRPRVKRGGKKLNFQLCDTMGLEEDAGIDLWDFAHILRGRIPDQFQFYPGAGIANDNPNLKQDHDLKDKIHVAAFVVDGSTIAVMPMPVLHKLKEIKKQVDRCGIPSAVILTKVDKVCGLVSEDLTNLFHSPDVRDCVDEVAEKFGIPRSQILIVKNYEKETEVEVPKDIITLVALQQLLRLADNFYDEQIDIIGLPDTPKVEGKQYARNV